MPDHEGLTQGEESFARRAGYGDQSVERMHQAGRQGRARPRVALLSVVAAVLISILIQALRPRLGKGWLLLIGMAFGAALIILGVLLDRRQKLSVRGPKAQGVPPT